MRKMPGPPLAKARCCDAPLSARWHGHAHLKPRGPARPLASQPLPTGPSPRPRPSFGGSGPGNFGRQVGIMIAIVEGRIHGQRGQRASSATSNSESGCQWRPGLRVKREFATTPAALQSPGPILILKAHLNNQCDSMMINDKPLRAGALLQTSLLPVIAAGSQLQTPLPPPSPRLRAFIELEQAASITENETNTASNLSQGPPVTCTAAAPLRVY